MTEYDIKRFALILAVQVEIEGMKATNKTNELVPEPLAFDIHDFQSKAEELRNLAYQPEETL